MAVGRFKSAILGVVMASGAAAQMAAERNPLFTESKLPYHLPPFADIRNEHFGPALDKGMAEQLAEVNQIASSRAKPAFENTIAALERSGRLLTRARRALSILTSSLTNPELDKIEAAYAPRFAAHSDAIRLNPALFARIQTLYDRRESLRLDAESKRLLERYHLDFIRSGAKLAPEGKEKLKAINAELAKLMAQFRQNLLGEINDSAVVVNTREELAGLPAPAIAAAAKDGKFAIRLTNTTGQPPLDRLENPDVRRRVMEASLARGMRGNSFDNRALVLAIVRKRAELAKLLGYASYAAYHVEDQTAGTVDEVNKLLWRLAAPAVSNAHKEAAELKAAAGGRDITAADWGYYSEKVRLARYAFDESQLRPYYEIRRVLVDGVFFAATKLYGITFKERQDLHGYSPDMFVFEVFDADGSPLGLFLGDFYARPNKRGGAWATAYVLQSGLTGEKPVIGIHQNVPKPPPGEPTLLTYDEVNTMFHEFGHALHGLFSHVKYPYFAGTNVPRDFVEFPSQVNEMWATWPEVFEHYAVHYQTGKPMPKDLLEKVTAAEKFNQGYQTTELVAATALDQAWHQLKPEEIPDDVVAFESAALEKSGLKFDLVPPRYRSTYFSHVFASSGYSAGYYSYLWSEVLDADTVEWFKQHGGLKRENGDRFRSLVLSRGGSLDAKAMYRTFRGADPDPKPFLQRRALD